MKTTNNDRREGSGAKPIRSTSDERSKCRRCNQLLTGRHCLVCLISLPEVNPETGVPLHGFRKSVGPNPEDGQAFIEVLKRYNLTVPRNAIEWRLGPQSLGSIPSLGFLSVRVLITNGVLAWFLLGDFETTFLGHLGNWEENQDEKEQRPRTPSKRNLKLTESD